VPLRVVLNDWNSGRIPYYTTPPKRGSKADRKHAAAEVVTDWAKEFNADKVFAAEESAVIAGLPGGDDADVEFVTAKVGLYTS
jgi:nuclear GTP-binding protein